MARKKAYNEAVVVEKAMRVFWRNGYENTSMQLLEKEMGINKFSIYARFVNKQGLFLECLKTYKSKVNAIFQEFNDSDSGVDDIKTFFYNSVKLCSVDGNEKGCLVTNAYNEFSKKEDEIINEQMTTFMSNLKEMFAEKLRHNTDKDEETILKEANYLVLAKNGLAAASQVNSEKEIEDYIEMTFKNL
jgi:AcrR family transcriptional regulator